MGAFAADAAAALALARANAGRNRRFSFVASDGEPDELELLRTGALQALVVRPGFHVGKVALDVAVGAVWWQAGPNQAIPPVVLTEESFKGLARGARPVGLDFGHDCGP